MNDHVSDAVLLSGERLVIVRKLVRDILARTNRDSSRYHGAAFFHEMVLKRDELLALQQQLDEPL